MSKYCHTCGTQAEDSQSFCAFCGTNIASDNLFKSIQSESPKKTSGACPECNQIDVVQTVAAIVDSGTGHSVGFGIGGPLIPTHGHLIGGIMASNNSTNLAARLSGYAKPDVGSKQGTQLGLLAGFGIVFFLAGNYPPAPGSGPLTWAFTLAAYSVPGFFGGLFVALVSTKPLRSLGNARIQNEIHRWEQNSIFMRQSKYCPRCDLVFSPDFAANPEEYKIWCFSR